MAVLSSKSFSIDSPKTRAKKGKLIRVTLPAGNIVKMYTQDAIAMGLITPPQTKAMPAPENKMMPAPAENKAQHAPPQVDADLLPSDFKLIKGLGRASARMLVAQGITSCEQLRTADVSFLSPKVQKAIEDWRNE
jgi:predicted flap endonuclease-1-like 5' DNA nuclease